MSSRPPLPPNRTCGSPASGSPVGGSPRQGLTCRSEAMVRIPIPANGTENRRDWSPVALMSKAVNMHLVCAASLSHALIPWLSPICLALGHSHRSAFCQPQTLDIAFARYPSARRVSRFRRFRFCLTAAGSPMQTGRIEFVILRMDRSPPAAPHLASRRRSRSRLQAGERLPGKDFHLSDHVRFQAHCRRAIKPVGATDGHE